MLSLRRFVCRYEDEDQQQCLPLMRPSARKETGLPIRVDLQKNFCVLSTAKASGPNSTSESLSKSVYEIAAKDLPLNLGFSSEWIKSNS